MRRCAVPLGSRRSELNVMKLTQWETVVNETLYLRMILLYSWLQVGVQSSLPGGWWLIRYTFSPASSDACNSFAIHSSSEAGSTSSYTSHLQHINEPHLYCYATTVLAVVCNALIFQLPLCIHTLSTTDTITTQAAPWCHLSVTMESINDQVRCKKMMGKKYPQPEEVAM